MRNFNMESVNMNRNVNQPIEAGPKSHVILCNLYSDFSKKWKKAICVIRQEGMLLNLNM